MRAERVADVALGFHCLGGEPKHHHPDGLTVDHDRGRDRVAPRGVHSGHAMHLHHHRRQRVGRGSHHFAIGVGDGQCRLASGRDRCSACQVRGCPAPCPLIGVTRCDRCSGKVVLTLAVGEPGDLVTRRQHRQRGKHRDRRHRDRQECQSEPDTERAQQRTTCHSQPRSRDSPSRYPAPSTVSTTVGSWGSGSILRRRFLMCESTVRS